MRAWVHNVAGGTGVAACCLIGAALPAAAAVEAPRAVDTCAYAAELTKAGHPRQARDLVLSAAVTQRDPCLATRRAEADRRITEAMTQALAAQRAAAEGNRAEAVREAKAAQGIDADNPIAAALAEGTAAPVPPATWKARWDAFFAARVDPLQDVVLPVLVVIAAIVVLARMALITPARLPRTTGRERIDAWVSGLLLAALAGALLTSVTASLSGPLAVMSCLGGVLLGYLAVRALWVALGTRLRMTVEVRDSKGTIDEAATGQVIAFIGQLGTERPRGLEVPRGADVTALTGTPITGAPAGQIMSAVATLWQFVFGVTPWRVRVDATSDHVQSVVVTRNGHTCAAAILDRDLLQLRTPRTSTATSTAKDTGEGADRLPSLHRFAAAMTIIELSKAYDGFDELYDVREWHSLGLHDVGTNHYSGPGDRAAAALVLARAVRYDPANLPAVVAYRHALDRDSTDSARLSSYLSFLSSISTDSRLQERHAVALRARVLLTIVVTAGNLTAANDLAGAHPNNEQLKQCRDALKCGVNLVALLMGQENSARPELETFVRTMKPAAAAAFLALREQLNRIPDVQGKAEEPDDEEKDAADQADAWVKDTSTFDPLAHYNYACLKRGLPQVAVSHLRLAGVDPDLRTFMLVDPMLQALTRTQAFRTDMAPAARTDLLAIEPFATHAAALKALGFTTAGILAQQRPWALARDLRIRRHAAAHLIEVAGLVKSLPRDLSPVGIEIADYLVKRHVHSRRALTAEPDKPRLAERLHEHLLLRSKDKPLDGAEGLERLLAWMESRPPRLVKAARPGTTADTASITT